MFSLPKRFAFFIGCVAVLLLVSGVSLRAQTEPSLFADADSRGASPTPVPAQPQVVNLSPDTATDDVGATRTWNIVVRDENGVSDLASVWFLAARALDWDAGITFMYWPPSRRLYVRDKGAWKGPIVPGSGVLETDRVFLDGARVSVSLGSDGKTLSLSLPLRVKSPMSGANSLWTRVEDGGGMVDAKSGHLGFVSHGKWNVGVSGNNLPSAVVAPGARGQIARLAQNKESVATLDLRDEDGSGNLESGWLSVAPQLDWGKGMMLYFEAKTKRLYLRSTGGAKWLGGAVVGQGKGILQNDAVSIRLEGCSMTALQNGIRLRCPITPKAALVGIQHVWTRVSDNEGHVAADADCPNGFSSGGLWTVTGVPVPSVWKTSFLPASRSSFSSPVNYSAWQTTAQKPNPVFDFQGGVLEQARDNPTGVWRRIGHYQDPNALAMEFQTDAPAWELLCAPTGGNWRVLVRDAQNPAWQVVGNYQLPQPGTPATQVFRRVDGVRARRRWRIEYSNQMALGIRLNAGDVVVAAPAKPPLARVVWCGDSFVEGAGAPAMWQGFAARAGALLRLDSHFDASGGTGYLTAGPPSWNRSAYGARVDNIVGANPSLVVIYGSTNDIPFAPKDVAVAARKFWTALQRALPNAKIVAIGPLLSGDNSQVRPLNQALAGAAKGSSVTFVDSSSWISGSGNVTSGRGDGNADEFISPDGVHPSPAGHAFMAQKVADALRPILNQSR